MTVQERKKLEGYIARYYDSYFHMDAVYSVWASIHKIQDTTLFILNEISSEEYCTQRSLRDRLGYSKQTISSALRRLEQEGMITRQRALLDQRNKIIRLTPKGKHYTDTIIARLRDAEVRAFKDWTDEEAEQILQCYAKLASALSQSLQADIDASAGSSDAD